MGESNKIYQAKVMNEKIKGIELPTIEDLVEDMLSNCGTALKKEEIDENICRLIGLPQDESIVGATSGILIKLESEGTVDHTSHGYWKKH